MRKKTKTKKKHLVLSKVNDFGGARYNLILPKHFISKSIIVLLVNYPVDVSTDILN